jgi:nucleoid-associated protein YgaU
VNAAGGAEGHLPEESAIDRREAVRAPRRAHAGALAASAVAAVALVALLVRWSAAPRIAPEARAVAPTPIQRGVERGAVDSPPPAAPDRLASRSAPEPGTAGSPPEPVAAPRAAPPSSFVVVARGDSLWRLAGVYLGAPSAWPRIHDLNRAAIADPDRIVPGQRLALPAKGR